MADQQPPEAPPSESRLTRLPYELRRMIFVPLYDEYLEEEKLRGGQYLPHSLAYISAPWNVFEALFDARDFVRTSRGAPVTMLHPDRTRRELAGLPKNAKLDLYCSDTDDWRPFDREDTFDKFSIPAAAKRALRRLANAKTLTVSATMSKLSNFPLLTEGRLSNIDRLRLLVRILYKLSTGKAPGLQQLHIGVDSNMAPEDVQTSEDEKTLEEDKTSEGKKYAHQVRIQRALHAHERRLWEHGADLFPEIEDLELAGLHCTVRPRLPPSLTKLDLTCIFTISMDDLLDMLQSLPSLRDLALSDCAQRLRSMTPDRHTPRSVHLPHLQKIALREGLLELVTILSRLEFGPTTSMNLSNDVEDSNDQDVTPDAISTLAREVQSRLETGGEENASVFQALDVKLFQGQPEVNTFDLHGYDGLPSTFLNESAFVGERTHNADSKDAGWESDSDWDNNAPSDDGLIVESTGHLTHACSLR
ncbi:unnamed protein product [Peniophora sp. CBMAI 1063]|nr:unnamed protein product [Peniophora sp. CBMAI 1063]